MIRTKRAGSDADLLRSVGQQMAEVMGGGIRFAAQPQPTEGAAPAPVLEFNQTGGTGVAFRQEPGGRQVLEVSTDGTSLPVLFDRTAVADARPLPPMLERDVPVPLADLGFSTVRISDHLWSRGIAFRLPEDWLIDVKERGILRFDFANVAGMPAESELRIRINGDVVRLIPLDRGGRLDAAPLEVRFDAAALRAGRNELTFEVSISGEPANQPCVTAGDPKVEIRDSSTLTVPSSPRMRIPGIGAWLSTGGPLTIVTAPAPGQAATDLEMFVELAAALEPAQPGAPARRLVVLPRADASRADFGRLEVARHLILSALIPVSSEPAPSAMAAGEPPLEVVQAGFVSTLPAEVSARALDVARQLQDLFLATPAMELASFLDGVQAEAVFFQLDPATPGDAYLLLSDDADPVEVVRALARKAQHGAPLDGQLATLDRRGGWRTWRDTGRLPELEEKITWRNWRAVLGNFASAQPRLFAGVLIGLALLSIAIAHGYITASRRTR